jgi:hypothetical protein
LSFNHRWETGVEWGKTDGEHRDGGRNWAIPRMSRAKKAVYPKDDYSKIGTLYFSENQVMYNGHNNIEEFTEADIGVLVSCKMDVTREFEELQDQLVENYAVKEEKNRASKRIADTLSLHWLRSRDKTKGIYNPNKDQRK